MPSEAFLTHSVLQDALVFAAAAVVVALLDRRERRRVVRVVLLGALGFVIHVAAHLAADSGLRAAPALDLTGRAIAAIAAVALLGTLFFDVLLPLVKMRPPRILRDLAIAAGAIAATLAVLSSGKVEIVGIVATSAVLTAVIGWALQDTLANVMGGLALHIDRSIEEGDWATWGEHTGIVREVGWRQTSIETRNGDRLVVPNSAFMKNAVLLRGKQMGSPPRERRWVTFNAEASAAPSAVIAAVETALRRDAVPDSAPDPAPDCVLVEFGDSWSRYAVRHWVTDLFRTYAADSAVRTRIWFALQREGIEMSVPVHRVLLTPEDGEHQERTIAGDVARKVEVLSRVSIFAPLHDDERRDLAAHLVHAPFAPGESIVLQGAAGHDLYILTKGDAEVRISVAGGPSRAVAALRAPDFFGEMGLLTGEPRKATVAAVSVVETWRVDKEAIHAILAKRPAIAEAIAALVSEREVGLAAVREGLSEEAKRMRVAKSQPLTLAKIREFFGIG